MTEYDGGGADLAQDFDFPVANPQHMVACIALPEQDVALLELIIVMSDLLYGLRLG
jgi:hypothetical protein